MTKYSDIISDGGLDPRNKFDIEPTQKREWVGLTDEEIVQVLGNVREQLDGNVFGAFAKAIEAKLKEKNT